MNNNRNNRRRGRNNNRNQGGSNSGNRIDSRARGNAPQLLDKYKKLAQDAQHNGDRVQAEYYLQFADHYFRVIADNKARQDEARSKRDEERQSGDDSDFDDEGDDRRRNRRSRSSRDDDQGQDDNRGEKRGRKPRGGSARSEDSQDSDEFEPAENPFIRKDEEAPKKRRAAPRKPRKSAEGEAASEGEIDASALPPAIGSSDGDKPKPAPRRRRKAADDTVESEDVSAVG